MKIYEFDGSANVCGANIRIQRLKKHVTQNELAARLQTYNILIGQKGISRMESGERFISDYELAAIGYALGVQLADLYRGTPLETKESLARYLDAQASGRR